MSKAIVVQCFSKLDTLRALCDSLLRADNIEQFHLIFWRDVPDTAKVSEERIRKTCQVEKFIGEFSEAFKSRFASIVVKSNAVPMGTCATCKASIDFALEQHEFVVFTEDDTLLTKDALSWIIDLSETDLLNREDVLGFALESIFFDARDRAVDDTFIRHAAQYASDLNLMHDYVDLKFMPSTCFATNRSKWLSFREIRGGKTGARDLAFFCKEHGIGAIFPVIARAVDVGMLHPDGYSVATRGGVDKVEEVKNTYLTSDSFPSKRGLPRMFSGNRDDLFRKSVRLDGF